MDVRKVQYGSPDAAKEFCRSLRETGFAVLTHHPIPIEQVQKVYGLWNQFFQSEEKHNYTFDPKTQAGYFPFRSENAKGQKTKDLKEFFHVYPRTKMPEVQAAATWEIYRALVALGSELLGWIQQETPVEIKNQLSMPLPKMIENSDENLLRILHYPPLTGTEEEGAVRAAAHEDINLITLLCAGTASGLQVRDSKGKWHDVPCDPGSIAINAGDMLQLATNKYYISTTHQVINPRGDEARKPRFSMPLFLHPRIEVPLTPTVTAGQYLDARLKDLGLK